MEVARKEVVLKLPRRRFSVNYQKGGCPEVIKKEVVLNLSRRLY